MKRAATRVLYAICTALVLAFWFGAAAKATAPKAGQQLEIHALCKGSTLVGIELTVHETGVYTLAFNAAAQCTESI